MLILCLHRYYAEYNCHFKLQNFPFDVQVCEMIFKLRTATKNYVEIRDGGLIYKGTKDLTEFEVSNITAMPGKTINDFWQFLKIHIMVLKTLFLIN